MPVVFFDGFDFENPTNSSVSLGNYMRNKGWTLTSATGANRFNSNAALAVGGYIHTPPNNGFYRLINPQSQDIIIAGFISEGVGISGTVGDIFFITDEFGNRKVKLQLNNLNDLLGVVKDENEVVIGTTSSNLIADSNEYVWDYIEFRVKSHLTEGAIQVRRNNTLILDLQNINTNQYVSTIGGAGGHRLASSGSFGHYDDIVIIDNSDSSGFQGFMKALSIEPSATFINDFDVVGDSTALKAIDDLLQTATNPNIVHDTESTYIQTNSPDQSALFVTSSSINSFNVSEIKALEINTFSSGNLGDQFAHLFEISGDTFQGNTLSAPIDFHISDENENDMYLINPFTGLSWTLTDIQNLKYGFYSLTGALEYLYSNYDDAVIADQPFARFKLHEQAGTSVIEETSNRNGIINGAPILGDPGPLRLEDTYGIMLDGVNDYIGINSVAQAMAANFTNEMTVELFFKTSINPATDTESCIFSLHTAAANNVYRLGIGINGSIYLSVDNDETFGSGYNDNEWHHLMVCSGTGDHRVYVDRELIGVSTQAGISFFNIHFGSIGQEWDAGPVTSDFFNGSISQLSIYNSKLSELSVLRHNDTGIKIYKFPVTSSEILFQIPNGSNIAEVHMIGAAGGGGVYSTPVVPSGAGAYSHGKMLVNPGELYFIRTGNGGLGGAFGLGGRGGFPGGGHGSFGDVAAGGGGGYSGLFRINNAPVLIAGAGSGSAAYSVGGPAGGGGALVGQSGGNSTGGTQTDGGSGSSPGQDGSYLQGGHANAGIRDQFTADDCAGAGAGYFGGGASSGDGKSSSGGSSFISNFMSEAFSYSANNDARPVEVPLTIFDIDTTNRGVGVPAVASGNGIDGNPGLITIKLTNEVISTASFDPTNKNSSVTLSENNRFIENNDTQIGTILSTTTHNNGNYYIEFDIVEGGPPIGTYLCIGFAKPGFNFSNYLGETASDSCGFFSLYTGDEMRFYNNGVITNYPGEGYKTGDLVGLAVKLGGTDLRIWYRKGDGTWLGGGNPETDIGPTEVIVGEGSADWHFAADVYTVGTKLRLRQDLFYHSLPTGFNAW